VTPEERVRAFMTAMTACRSEAHEVQASRDNARREALTERLRAIYEEHCSAKGKGPNRFGRNLIGPGPVVDPPKFNQEILRVENGPKKSVSYVITKPRADTNTLWRFTVTVDKAGTPLIDDLHGIALTPAGKPHGEWAKFGY